ncbi:zf-HC2 domain-containing protein [bacterium]|nr:zf-HC2 domain-containing protein [candidate division CSSED10-310 bacterium]
MNYSDLNCRQVKRLAVAYSQGRLAEIDARAVWDHLQGCRRCREEQEELQGTSQWLVTSFPEFEPSDALIAAVMIQLPSVRRLESSWWASLGEAMNITANLRPLTAMALAIVVFVSSYALFYSPGGEMVGSTAYAEPVLSELWAQGQWMTFLNQRQEGKGAQFAQYAWALQATRGDTGLPTEGNDSVVNVVHEIDLSDGGRVGGVTCEIELVSL